MKLEYQTFNDVVRILEEMSGGQRNVVSFDVENKYWVFYLNTNNGRDAQIRVKLLAI